MYLKYILHSITITIVIVSVKAVFSPIILIPGDGGSQLYASLNKSTVPHLFCSKQTYTYNLWLNLELLAPLIIDCFVDNMKLSYDNVTRTTTNAPGVNISVPGFGNPNSVEYLDPSSWYFTKYFYDIGMLLYMTFLGQETVSELFLANMLRLHGYLDNITLRGAPYDFRKGPNELHEFFENLKTLIETTAEINGHQRVVLITHSLGSLLSLKFLQNQTQTWKDKYIRMFIPISGPWGGAVKALKVFCIGDNFGSYVLSQYAMKQIQMTFPSSAWLLPNNNFWTKDDIFVSTPSKNYTTDDYKDLFNDLNYSNGWDMLTDMKPFELNLKPPGVEVYCFYSKTIKNTTVERLAYKSDDIVNDSKPKLVVGVGDDTVNLRSLESCKLWQKSQKQKVRVKMYEGVDHLGILGDPRLVADIEELLAEI